MVVVTPGGPAEEERTAIRQGPAVLVVDRQPLAAQALARLLAEEGCGCTVSSDSGEAAVLLREGAFDVLICDAHVRPISPFELLRSIADEKLATRMVLLGEEDDDALLVDAFHAGAAAILKQSSGEGGLVNAIHAIEAGHRVLDQSLVDGAMRRPGESSPVRGRELRRLTAAEQAIFRLIAEGRSIPDISRTRRTTVKTVRNHLASIYRKLGLHSRTEAILLARRFGVAADEQRPGEEDSR